MTKKCIRIQVEKRIGEKTARVQIHFYSYGKQKLSIYIFNCLREFSKIQTYIHTLGSCYCLLKQQNAYIIHNSACITNVWVIRISFLCFFQRCENTSSHLVMKFLKLVVSILLKSMLRKSEQVRCSLYRRLYSLREQLVSLLAEDEYKQSKTLQTLVEHLTIEKKITKTFFTAVKRAQT